MANKQISCPNCGAQLKKSQLIEVTCPYCGSKIKNPLSKLKGDEEIIGSIVPSNVSETHVKETLISEFINKKSIPQDIFDKLEIVSNELYYLPMRRFSGSTETNWSCTVVYTHKDRQGNSYEDCRPASGTASGRFARMVLAHNGQDLPNEIKSFVKVLPVTRELHDSIKKIEQSHLQDENGSDIRVIQSNLTIDDCWKDKALQQAIEYDAHGAAYSQTSGWDTRDFRFSSRWRYNHTDLILMPIWYLRYKYDGQEYHFIMDGLDERFDYTYPKNNTSSSRSVMLFLRFSFMVTLGLSLFALKDEIPEAIEPISLFAILGGVILTFLFIIEYGKSSYELRSKKLIGLAKFRNEIPPNIISVNYVRFKRINQFLMWVLIGAVAVWSSIAYIKHPTYNLYMQQKYEQTQKDHLDEITPDLFFNNSKDKIGHLRQNIRKRLAKLGFVKEEITIKMSDDEEKYTLYSNENPLVRVLINFEFGYLYQNYSDKIKCIKISVVDDRLASSFIEEFKSKLKSMGYKFKRYSPSYNSPYGPDKSYMLIEETHKEDALGRHYVKYNAVVFEGNDINCYAKDGIE